VVKLVTSRENVQPSQKKGKALIKSKSEDEDRRAYIKLKIIKSYHRLYTRNARILHGTM